MLSLIKTNSISDTVFNPFSTNVPILQPWKPQKTGGFLTFSRGIEVENLENLLVDRPNILSNVLSTHLMPLVTFYIPGKYKKIRGFIFWDSVKRDYSANIYLLSVNNRNTNDVVLVFLFLILNIILTFSSVSVVDFQQLNDSWECQWLLLPVIIPDLDGSHTA